MDKREHPREAVAFKESPEDLKALADLSSRLECDGSVFCRIKGHVIIRTTHDGWRHTHIHSRDASVQSQGSGS